MASMLLLDVNPRFTCPDLNSLPSKRRLDPVNPYVELGLVVMIPTAAGYGLIYSARGIRWATERWPRPRPPEPEPVERLTATLRRLRAELESLETRSGVPSKHV